MKTFNLPDLGEGLPDAEISEWHVKVGDDVTVDQPLVSMETAKAVVEVPSPFTGRIDKLFGDAGDVIKTGNPLVGYTAEGEASEDKPREDTGTVVGEIPTGGAKIDESVAVSGGGRSSVRVTPAVRALAKKLNVDLNHVTPSGANGLITAGDVKEAQARLADAGDLELLRGVRRSMAQAMEQSHAEVVPVTLSEDADVHNWSADEDISVRLVQALVSACQQEPALNAWYDSKAVGLRKHDSVNVGLAVDSDEGLFVPVIEKADALSKEDIREKINTLKTGVFERTLAPQAFQGATITLSNFGKFAGRYANPIIVPPMVAIIAVGKSRDAVVAVDGAPAIRRTIPLSLTFDHRAVTGGEASRFLAHFIAALEA